MFKSKYAPVLGGQTIGNAALIYYATDETPTLSAAARGLLTEFGRYAREFPDADLELVEVYHTTTPTGPPSLGWRIIDSEDDKA